MKDAIVIASGKGGTGKSTVAAGLSHALANEGVRVLLIDCDSGMRGLDIMLGITQNLVFDMADAVSGGCTVENTVYPCSSKQGLFLMPAPLSAYDEVAPGVMEQIVQGVADIFDYIIIDSPAGVGSGFETAAYAANRALVVVNTEPTSLRGAQNISRGLAHCGIGNAHLLINRFDEHSFYKAKLYSDLDEVIDTAAIQLIGIVPEDKALAASLQSGKGCPDKSYAMKAFSRIAGRVRGRREPLLIK